MNRPTKEYYVDLIAAYFNIEKELSLPKNNRIKDKKGFLERQKKWLQLLCKNFGIDFKHHFTFQIPIFVYPQQELFEVYLGFFLIAYDIHKTEAFLEYQNAQFPEKEKGVIFPVFVENLVYRYIKDNSPFDNSERLDRIMQWVNGRRYFAPITEEGTREIRILWKQSLPELTEAMKNKIIDNASNIPLEKLAFSCFYIEGINFRIATNKLKFSCTERETLVFFSELIRKDCIPYSEFTNELLRKISENCLNKKGEPYKIRQLQTVLTNFRISTKKIS